MGNDILGWVPNGHPKREQLLNTETVSAPIDLVSAIMLSAIFPGKNAVRLILCILSGQLQFVYCEFLTRGLTVTVALE